MHESFIRNPPISGDYCCETQESYVFLMKSHLYGKENTLFLWKKIMCVRVLDILDKGKKFKEVHFPTPDSHFSVKTSDANFGSVVPHSLKLQEIRSCDSNISVIFIQTYVAAFRKECAVITKQQISYEATLCLFLSHTSKLCVSQPHTNCIRGTSLISCLHFFSQITAGQCGCVSTQSTYWPKQWKYEKPDS